MMHMIVQRSGEDVRGPPYPLWHLEPLYVRKLPATNPQKRSTSEEEPEPESVSHVQESHSVFSNLNGNKQGFAKQIEQGITQNIIYDVMHSLHNIFQCQRMAS